MKIKPTDYKKAERHESKSRPLAAEIEPSSKKIHEQIYKKVIPKSVRSLTGHSLSNKNKMHPALRKRPFKKEDSHSDPDDSPPKHDSN